MASNLKSGADTVAALENLQGILRPPPGGLHAPNPHELESLSGVFAGPTADGCRLIEKDILEIQRSQAFG